MFLLFHMNWSDYHPIKIKYPEILILCEHPVTTETVAHHLNIHPSTAYYHLIRLRWVGLLHQSTHTHPNTSYRSYSKWQTIKTYNVYIKPVFYWFIRFNETSTVTIYSEENGEVLWQHQGDLVPQLRMLRFKGIYLNELTEKGNLHIELRGTLAHIQIIEK